MNRDGARGALLGLACGDALGRPVEFKSPQEISTDYGRLAEMVGYGTWGRPAGTVTDDTDQAMCIARSLVERESFDPADIADRFVDWYDTDPFDIGNMTRRSLQRLKRGDSWDQAGEQVWAESPEGSNAGNGSVMRSPPLALAFASDPRTLADTSRRCSRITHADPRCTYGSAVLNLTIVHILQGHDHPLETAIETVADTAPEELIDSLSPIVAEDTPSELQTSPYVVTTLQTALHDAFAATTPEEAIVTAVNRGGDADTIGAVAGSVAGARFGASALPDRWLDAIAETEELESLATELGEVA